MYNEILIYKKLAFSPRRVLIPRPPGLQPGALPTELLGDYMYKQIIYWYISGNHSGNKNALCDICIHRKQLSIQETTVQIIFHDIAFFYFFW